MCGKFSKVVGNVLRQIPNEPSELPVVMDLSVAPQAVKGYAADAHHFRRLLLS